MPDYHYRRWPCPGDYIDTQAIVSYWPKYFNFPYCIAPAINYEFVNHELDNNPIGTFRWGRRLLKNTGMLWHYGDLDFPGYPLFKGFPQAQITLIPGGDIYWSFTFDIVRGIIQKTAEGFRGGYIWPFVGGHSYPAHNELPVWVPGEHYGPTATLNTWPCTLADKWEDSYET